MEPRGERRLQQMPGRRSKVMWVEMKLSALHTAIGSCFLAMLDLSCGWGELATIWTH